MLVAKPIYEVISTIKKLAVREENTMVARVQLHQMRQDRVKLICSFGTPLCGQAGFVNSSSLAWAAMVKSTKQRTSSVMC